MNQEFEGVPDEQEEQEEQIPEPLNPIEGHFTDLFTATMEPPSWIIEDLLPPGLVFVGAPPKSGKSTIEMAIALLVAGFECKALPPFLSQAKKTGPVMGFSAEATAGELRHMVEVGMGCKGEANEGIMICDDPFAWRLDDEDGLKNILEWLENRKPRLLFLDPLRDFHSLEEKDSGDMNRLLRPLQRWAKKNDAACMVVHHAKKKQEGDKAGYTPDDLRGTTALYGIADAVLMITPREDEYITVRASFKRAKSWERTFRMATYDRVGTPAQEKMGEMEMQILRCLDIRMLSTKDIAKQCHISLQRAEEGLATLKRNGLAAPTEKGWKSWKTKAPKSKKTPR